MTFQYNDIEIHYEIHGEGPPLLILNGIMMSTLSWEPLLPPLIKNHKVILLDFIDQGRSGKCNGELTQLLQVDMMESLLEYLEIDKVNILGLSYGGEVALQFTLKYPDRVDRLILSNTTPNTGYWLREIGESWIANLDDPLGFYLTTIPIIYSPGYFNTNEESFEERKELLLQLFSDPNYMSSMNRLINSANNYDVRDQLKNIDHPTLVISGDQDYITPRRDQEVLVENIPNASWVMIPNCGHASMYEKSVEYLTLVLGFLSM